MSIANRNFKDATIYLTPVTEPEVIKAIENLNNSTCPDVYGITAKYVKLVAEVIAKQLTTLINKFFTEGNFLSNLKIDKVIPIYKKRNKTKPENYRPVSIVSTYFFKNY